MGLCGEKMERRSNVSERCVVYLVRKRRDHRGSGGNNQRSADRRRTDRAIVMSGNRQVPAMVRIGMLRHGGSTRSRRILVVMMLQRNGDGNAINEQQRGSAIFFQSCHAYAIIYETFHAHLNPECTSPVPSSATPQKKTSVESLSILWRSLIFHA